MIGILISYLTQKFQTFNYLQTVYGLAGFEDGDNKYLWVYQNNEKVLLNLDTHQSCSLFLTNGKVDTTQEESQLVANEYNVTKKYPFKALIYIQGNENVNCSTESQRIADSIQRSITGRQKQILASTQLTDAYIEVTATDFDKDAIYQRYYSSGGLQEKDILIEIEFDFVISGNQDCFVDSPCDDGDYIFSFDAPKTLCEKINECLDIPTSNGQYVLDITGGVKSWSEYSPTGAVVISKTQAQFLALVSGGTLEFPATYKITDVQNGLYIDTLSASTFSPSATLSFLAPDYSLRAQYHHTDGAIANNAIVTWGGFYWTNTSGASATPNLTSEAILDNTGAFTKVTKSVANGYETILLDVSITDTLFVFYGKDVNGNEVKVNEALNTLIGFNPIDVFQWNDQRIFNNSVLVCNNKLSYSQSIIYSNIGDFNYEPTNKVASISQNLLNNSTISSIYANQSFVGSKIYRNVLSGIGSSIRSNIQTNECIISSNILSGVSASIEGYNQTSLCRITGNTLSGGLGINGVSVTIAYGTQDDDSEILNNVLSGDGAVFFDNHQHEACKINGNTLSGDNTTISHVVQYKTDECNDNTISADNELIDIVFQDGNTNKLNNCTITAGKSIQNIRMSNSEITNSSVKLSEINVQGIDLNLTGFTADIISETYQSGDGWFTVTHNFTSSPLNSGNSLLYNLIPIGSRITKIEANGTLTGTEIEIGLETDDEGIISGNVGLLPLSWSGFSNAATGNRSLKIKAVGGNITAGSLTVKIEFVL
jgi:hypothetical protein